MRFQRAMWLFGWLGGNITKLEQSLPQEEAQRQIINVLTQLEEEDFTILLDLMEMIDTEPGKRLLGAMDITSVRKLIDNCKATRKAIDSARKN